MDVDADPELDKEKLEQAISAIKDEISALRSQQKLVVCRRKEALDKILGIKGSVRVFCRIRPALEAVNGNKTNKPVSVDGEKIAVRSVGAAKKAFSVDKVFDEMISQEDLFREVEPTLRSALDGHNVCVFAYGQTGTGKTFTMEGTIDRPGIVHRSLEVLFRRASEDGSASFTFSMSMLEIYMGSLRDLLAHKQYSIKNMDSMNKWNLNILASSNGSIEVEGLKEVPLADFKQAKRWYTKGMRARSTSCTHVNEASSRSHCLTRITISRTGSIEKGNEVQVSKLWMVDLGGSERLLKTGAAGLTLDEGKAINLSLSALGDVISALKRKTAHIPYRNSKLTQILSDSLGNGSKVLMFVHVSTNEDDVGETVCSLKFAGRVRAIDPNRAIPEAVKKQKEKCIAVLDAQINDTGIELKNISSRIEIAQNLLQEKMKLHADNTSGVLEEQSGSPRSPLTMARVEAADRSETAKRRACQKICLPLPHFMAPTACSRQRRSYVEASQSFKKYRPDAFNLYRSQSQSLSLLESSLRLPSQPSKNKELATSKIKKLKPYIPEDALCNSRDSKLNVVPNQRSSSSLLNRRPKTHQHKRRMSDLT